jgi:hypothetical protein
MTLFIRRQRNATPAHASLLGEGVIRVDLAYLTTNPPVLFIIRLPVLLHP